MHLAHINVYEYYSTNLLTTNFYISFNQFSYLRYISFWNCSTLLSFDNVPATNIVWPAPEYFSKAHVEYLPTNSITSLAKKNNLKKLEYTNITQQAKDRN